MELDLTGAMAATPVSDVWLTPLHAAAVYGQAGICQVLIAHGASIDAQDSISWTPLMYSVRHGETQRHINVTRTLLQAGARADIVNELGETALMISVHDTVRHQDSFEQFDHALHPASVDGMMLLLDMPDGRALIDQRDHSGATALTRAMETSNVVAVRMLLQYGADPNGLAATGRNSAGLHEEHMITPLMRIALKTRCSCMGRLCDCRAPRSLR
jgi:ankyrin repeat protein